MEGEPIDIAKFPLVFLAIEVAIMRREIGECINALCEKIRPDMETADMREKMHDLIKLLAPIHAQLEEALSA